jgi:hypothetical protein
MEKGFELDTCKLRRQILGIVKNARYPAYGRKTYTEKDFGMQHYLKEACRKATEKMS